jgi:hypothetical protein
VCQGGPGTFILQHEDAWDVVGNAPATGDIGLKGSVWRWDRVNANLSNGLFSASLNVLYHLKAGPTGAGALVSCGYGQPARQMNLAFSGNVQFRPDWTIHVAAKPNISPGNDCQVTFLNFNATPFIVKKLNSVASNYLNAFTSQLEDKSSALKPLVSNAWSMASRPIAIADNVWLNLSPKAINIMPPTVENGQLEIRFSLDANPDIAYGKPPEPSTVPLPNLGDATGEDKFEIFLKAGSEYTDVNATLSRAVAGKTVSLGDSFPKSLFSINIDGVEVSNLGNKLLVAVKLGGRGVGGTLFLVGTPQIATDPELHTRIYVPDLDYDVATKNALIGFGSEVFHDEIRQALKRAASWDVSAQLKDAENKLNASLKRKLSDQIQLDGAATDFGPAQIWVGPTGIFLYYRVAGKMGLKVGNF